MSKYLEVNVKQHPKEIVETKTCPNQVLYRAPVHFMGRKAPAPSVDGLESIQKPLREMYTACSCVQVMKRDTPRDGYLVVLSSGLCIVPVNPLDQKLWIRIQDFKGCGVVRGVGSDYTPNGAHTLTFMPINSPQARTSPLPTIFTVLAARGECLPLIDCYAFSCPSEEVAISLASSTEQAFSDRSGWSNSNKPPFENLCYLDEQTKCPEPEDSCEFVNPELYKKPPLRGFFYAPSPGMIRSYDLGVEAEATLKPELELVPDNTQVPHECLIVSQDIQPQQNYFCPSFQAEIIRQPAETRNIYIEVDKTFDQCSNPAKVIKKSYEAFKPRQCGTNKAGSLTQDPRTNTCNLVDLNQWISAQQAAAAVPNWTEEQEVYPQSEKLVMFAPEFGSFDSTFLQGGSYTYPTEGPYGI
ncbi:hypothetical protein HELRODRAFT_189438 [Helobdella robusta]|uniref:Uncharacterized protein n=1 Tax=Helobdella robusta TaxID=6412 RepID=T1FR21_HELRO|nr:hypothetical protein HELRODRAFT_189438 [Helobdella robusta]ESN94575.1 hypothetical protein HELRODRAFT_189438 [Helobdella robusta]